MPFSAAGDFPVGRRRADLLRRRGRSSARGAMPARHVSRVRGLYKRILQLHRALPPDLKALGDQYVKDEFRRHKAVGSGEAQRFLQEWEASDAPSPPPYPRLLGFLSGIRFRGRLPSCSPVSMHGQTAFELNSLKLVKQRFTQVSS